MRSFPRSALAAVVLLASLSLPVEGQTPNPVVGVLPLTLSADDEASTYAARAYEGHLVQVLGKLRRISVLDRTQTKRVGAEKEQQKSSDFIDSKSIAAQGASFGAQLVVAANVDKVALVEATASDGDDYYEGNISLSIRIIDVATQEVVASEVINTDASSGGKGGLMGVINRAATFHQTPADAITAAVRNSEKKLLDLFNETWPLRFAVIQAESVSPDSNRVVLLLDGGRADGAREKMDLVVMEVTQMQAGGRTITREKALGELEIIDLEGEELSTGVVKKKEVARAIAQRLSAGATLYATLPK